jgi:hypothetical protein
MCAGLSITPVVATAQNRAIDSEGVIVEQYANGDVLQYHLNEHYCIVLATGYNVKQRNHLYAWHYRCQLHVVSGCVAGDTRLPAAYPRQQGYTPVRRPNTPKMCRNRVDI